jgi:hypothetical protein
MTITRQFNVILNMLMLILIEQNYINQNLMIYKKLLMIITRQFNVILNILKLISIEDNFIKQNLII